MWNRIKEVMIDFANDRWMIALYVLLFLVVFWTGMTSLVVRWTTGA